MLPNQVQGPGATPPGGLGGPRPRIHRPQQEFTSRLLGMLERPDTESVSQSVRGLQPTQPSEINNQSTVGDFAGLGRARTRLQIFKLSQPHSRTVAGLIPRAFLCRMFACSPCIYMGSL